MIHWLGNLAAFVAAASALTFCFVYALTAPWWRSPHGRHQMSFTALLGLVFLFASYRAVVAPDGTLPRHDEVARMAIFWLVALSLVWQLRLLYHAQLRPALRRNRESRNT